MLRKINKTLTIDQVDLSYLSRESKSVHVSQDIEDCIYNAAEAKNVDALKKIIEIIQTKSSNKIISDRIIDDIYFKAIVFQFSPDTMEKLLNAIPIDINREIKHIYRGMCRPPVVEKDALLNLAVAYHHADMVDFLLAKGADVNRRSNKGETVEQELERILERDRKKSNGYDVQVKERMLKSIQNTKEKLTYKI